MFSFVTSHARDFLAGHTHTHVHAFCDGRSSIKGLRARATAHTCIWVIGLIVGDISASAVFFSLFASFLCIYNAPASAWGSIWSNRPQGWESVKLQGARDYKAVGMREAWNIRKCSRVLSFISRKAVNICRWLWVFDELIARSIK